jgi:ABC-type Fe3+/spermidine/putrescine transport system ATPase subunit
VSQGAHGEVALKVCGTTLRAIGAEASSGDGSVLCMVRPEKISVRRAGASPSAGSAANSGNPGINALQGTVRETVFMGEMIRYSVELPGGALVTAKQQHRAGTPILSPADPAMVEWDVADTRLV